MQGRQSMLNPIPTGLCHVITVYGLIQPSAGRNKVNRSKYKAARVRQRGDQILRAFFSECLPAEKNHWLNAT